MSANENRALYLAWLRTVHPEIYSPVVLGAVRDHLTNTLRGLGDGSVPDMVLLDPSTFDLTSMNVPIDIPAPTIDIASDPSILSTLSNSADNLFSTIVNAAPQLANTYVQSQGQLNLLNVNTARAKAGLPPLTNVNGIPVTAASLAPANAQTLAMDQALSSVGGGGVMLLVLGGLGLLAVLAMSK